MRYILTKIGLKRVSVKMVSKKAGLKWKTEIRSQSGWHWYINIFIDVLGIIHHPIFYLKQCFGFWTLPLSLGKRPTHLGSAGRTRTISRSGTDTRLDV
jgi:hypothetical protein